VSDESPTPGERRIRELLAPLARETATPAPDMVRRLVQTVRWQAGVRGAVRVAGTVAGGMVDCAALLLGLGSRRREPR
jgi:hypothetical protein